MAGYDPTLLRVLCFTHNQRNSYVLEPGLLPASMACFRRDHRFVVAPIDRFKASLTGVKSICMASQHTFVSTGYCARNTRMVTHNRGPSIGQHEVQIFAVFLWSGHLEEHGWWFGLLSFVGCFVLRRVDVGGEKVKHGLRDK